MDYQKLLSTLGRSNLRYTVLDEELVVCSKHIAVYLSKTELPASLRGIAVKLADSRAITRHEKSPHDNAVFTGLSFVRGTRTVMAFMAQDNGRKYPIFVDKRYIDLLGDPIAVCGTGEPLKPLYYAGKKGRAYICPMRITEEDVRKVIYVAGELRHSLALRTSPL